MVKNYQDINNTLAKDFYKAGKEENDELVKFLFYFQSLQNLYVKYSSSTSGDRKMLQDYISNDAIMDMLFEQIDLNDKYIDVFLETPVFDLTFNPNKDKEYYLTRKMPNSWGAVRNETDKSIKNFQIIYGITGLTEECEFDEVMFSLFNTIYKIYTNAAHSYYGEIEEIDRRFIESSALILDKVLPEMLKIRDEDNI